MKLERRSSHTMFLDFVAIEVFRQYDVGGKCFGV